MLPRIAAKASHLPGYLVHIAVGESKLKKCHDAELCPLVFAQINDVDDFGLRVYNTVKRHRILPVDISLNSGSLLVTVGKDAQQPPYRIENR